MCKKSNYKSLRIPIEVSERFPDTFVCTCKMCRGEGDNYIMCDICHRIIWCKFRSGICTLYSYRYLATTPKVICFYCRQPYYEKGMNSGDIHRLLLPN